MKKVLFFLLLAIITMYCNSHADDKSLKMKTDEILPASTNKEKTNTSPYDSSVIFIHRGSTDNNGHFIYPCADLLIEDHDGLKTGYDPITGIYYDEIPKSHYYIEGVYDASIDQSRDTSKIIAIMQPSAGEYKLYVIDTGAGNYDLRLSVYDPELNPSVKRFEYPSISKYQTNTYSFFYSKTVDAGISVNFDKHAKSPSNVNKFLAYKGLAGRQTTLPSGTTIYNLTILYGDAIIPSSFKAKLNDADITNLFDPVPGSTEVVTLELIQGRNTLVLSSEANLPDRIAEDKDSLEFIVH